MKFAANWPLKAIAPLTALATFALAGRTQAQQQQPAQQATSQRPNILFCITDDQSWIHTSINGDPAVKTPVFDRIARNGVLFPNAFCNSPSCSPSRAAVLTGQDFVRLEEGSNLLGFLPVKFPVYPDILERAGYSVGFTRKGWGPGNETAQNRTRNPAGPKFPDFTTFLADVPQGKPFCFWFGTTDPHRPFDKDIAQKEGANIRPQDIAIPPFLPDVPTVRADMHDYLAEIQRFDRELGEMLDLLKQKGQLDNTLVIVTSDNGMPFARAKMQLYDYGTRMPLAVQWPARIPGGRVVTDFVNHIDFAPTFLEAAGLQPLPEMTGRSLLPILTSRRGGRVETARDRTHFGRERHDIFRREEGNPFWLGYPMRAVRTDDYLYIRNFETNRVPAADSPRISDSDAGPTKDFLRDNRDNPQFSRFHQLAYGLRPAEELYRIKDDPGQINNLAGDPRLAGVKTTLRADLESWMKRTGDPRAFGRGEVFDTYPPRPAPPKAANQDAPPQTLPSPQLFQMNRSLWRGGA